MEDDPRGSGRHLRCAVLDDELHVAAGLADWNGLSPRVETVFFHEHLPSSDLAATLADFDIVVLMRERTPFPASLIRQLPRLKLIVTAGSRNGALDVQAARDQGICVCGTGVLETPTVELTWALILSLIRHLPEEFARFAAGGAWQTGLGEDLAGRQIGIIGLGRLGLRVARVAQAFDMRVVAWSHNLTRDRCAGTGVTCAASLHELLAGSDIVTIHMVLSERTLGLIGAPEFALMKREACLVNTSRAAVVDSAALGEALATRQIAGAAIDVFDQEPLPPEHVWRRTDHLVATPHLGYVTTESYRLLYRHVVEDIGLWLDGTPAREILQDHPALVRDR